MNKETKLTKKIYTEGVKREWRRLTKDPFHRLEFETTLRFLKKYLPKNGFILDAGGGPGRYSIELAKLGHDVILLDLVSANLDFAKKQIKKSKVNEKIKEVVEGTITDLSRFADNSFDAILCLGGALSHVHPEQERQKAISELVRVAKKNAPIFVSVMGKLGTITRFHRWVHEVKDTEHFRRFYLKGDDYQWHGGKAYAHFFELNELKSLFDNKADFLENVGLEGLATPSQEQINKMAKKEPEAWKNWQDMHYELCTNPMVAEFSLHFMVIVKKK
ncbi:MAG: class I SAM-dependent methyltransferase [Candidatus Falkowbacteria bacterium]